MKDNNETLYMQIDADWNAWRCSECGCDWRLEEGDPVENGMNFCPQCGRRIVKIVHAQHGESEAE